MLFACPSQILRFLQIEVKTLPQQKDSSLPKAQVVVSILSQQRVLH